MTRGRHVGLVQSDREINLAVENVARWHICAIRRRKDGTITQVRHVQFGWISVEIYYQLQKLHDLVPLAQSIIEGGYRMKAALWSYEIPLEVLASGFGIPMALVLITVAATLYIVDLAAGQSFYAMVDLASLALPFGELWLLWRGASLIYSFITGTVNPAAGTLAGVPISDFWLSLFTGGNIIGALGESIIFGESAAVIYSSVEIGERVAKWASGEFNSVSETTPTTPSDLWQIIAQRYLAITGQRPLSNLNQPAIPPGNVSPIVQGSGHVS